MSSAGIHPPPPKAGKGVCLVLVVVVTMFVSSLEEWLHDA